jgi:hypothetical protein
MVARDHDDEQLATPSYSIIEKQLALVAPIIIGIIIIIVTRH